MSEGNINIKKKRGRIKKLFKIKIKSTGYR